MSKDYIWIFNTAALASGISGAFSLEYHIPGSKIKIDPQNLVGSRIWLIVRDGNESFLYAMLTPSSIELYQEGKYKGDFLLRCEPFASVRLLPRHESRDPWSTVYAEDSEITELTEAQQEVLTVMTQTNHRVGFAPPSRAIVDSVPKTAFTDLERAVPDQLMSTLRTVAFGDVSRPRSLPKGISALGAVALEILKSTHPNLNEADVVSLLAALDPMAEDDAAELMKDPEDILKVLSSLPPVVDTFLEEIDPDKISPRTFVAQAKDSSLEWLDKTNDAEQAHEQILKDLVLYLKSRGFKVYKTRSFDLFAEKAGVKFLCEIKSANGRNAVPQGEKGIVQLLRYSTALTDEKSAGTKFVLVLQDSGQPAVQQYLSKMAGRAGSELWLYDDDKDWPHRILSCAFPDFVLQ